MGCSTEGQVDISRCCAFTGHRPHKFPWKYDETDKRCVKLKEILTNQVVKLTESEITHFYSGMADGSDVWLSQIVLDLRGAGSPVQLHCVLLCENQSDGWSEAAQRRYHTILGQANSIEYVSRTYQKDCMLKRNRRLVESAGILLAVYNGEWRGGTAATIRYARKLERKIIRIHPISLEVVAEQGHI